ncbi:MAG: hypothetical protein KDN20_16480 [Verrucomicrobiae bacterium]|nr:hypothetical protein [Verrucomicrobiae bacterium]
MKKRPTSGKPQTIFRRDQKKGSYTKVHNAILKSPDLSGLAKAILVDMLSYPDDWTFYQEVLRKDFKEGRDAFKRALSELEVQGYVRRVPQTRQQGRFQSGGYTVHEEPLPPGQRGATAGKSVAGKSVNGSTVDGESVAGEPDTTNTNITKTNKTNNPLIPLEGGDSFFGSDVESSGASSFQVPEEWSVGSLKDLLINERAITADLRKELLHHPLVRKFNETFPNPGWTAEVPRQFLKKIKNGDLNESIIEKLFEARDLLDEIDRRPSKGQLVEEGFGRVWSPLVADLRSAAELKILDNSDLALDEDEAARRSLARVAEKMREGSEPVSFTFDILQNPLPWMEHWLAGKAADEDKIRAKMCGSGAMVIGYLVEDEFSFRTLKGIMKRADEIGFDFKACFGVEWSEVLAARERLEKQYKMAKKLGVAPRPDY